MGGTFEEAGAILKYQRSTLKEQFCGIFSLTLGTWSLCSLTAQADFTGSKPQILKTMITGCLQKDVVLKGTPSSPAVLNSSFWPDCRKGCRKDMDCQFWCFDLRNCHFFKDITNVERKDGSVSGPRECPGFIFHSESS